VGAREPPSQLQEALKDSAKVDAEHFVHIQGIFRDHLGNIEFGIDAAAP
jgi:hypothetical protein